MTAIKEWNNNYDFRVRYSDQIAKVFLKKGLMVSVGAKEGDDKVYQSAVREDEEFGLMVWDEGERMWCAVNTDIQEAYSDYIAERELLKEPKRKRNEVK